MRMREVAALEIRRCEYGYMLSSVDVLISVLMTMAWWAVDNAPQPWGSVFAPLFQFTSSVPRPRLRPRAIARRILVNTDLARLIYRCKQENK